MYESEHKPTTPEYREKRLQKYKEAIDKGEVLPGFNNLVKQISTYDQLCMIHKDLIEAERRKGVFTLP